MAEVSENEPGEGVVERPGIGIVLGWMKSHRLLIVALVVVAASFGAGFTTSQLTAAAHTAPKAAGGPATTVAIPATTTAPPAPTTTVPAPTTTTAPVTITTIAPATTVPAPKTVSTTIPLADKPPPCQAGVTITGPSNLAMPNGGLYVVGDVYLYDINGNPPPGNGLCTYVAPPASVSATDPPCATGATLSDQLSGIPLGELWETYWLGPDLGECIYVGP